MPYPAAFRPARPAFDVLVAAGDICEGSARAVGVVAALAGGRPAVFVLGNHQPWQHDLAAECKAARRAAERHGVVLLDDAVAACAGVRFVGGTLWTDGGLAGPAWQPGQATGEPICIDSGAGRHRITAGDAAALHGRTRRVIEATLARPPARRAAPGSGDASRAAPVLPVAGAPDRVGGGPRGLGPVAPDRCRHGHAVGAWAPASLGRPGPPGGTRIVCNPAATGFTNPAFRDDCVVEV